MTQKTTPFLMFEQENISEVSKKHNVNWEKIRKDVERIAPLLDRKINPREKFHLDTTKLAFHKDRVDAWLRGERVAPITMDMALTQKCTYSCIYCYAGLQYNPAATTTWDTYENFLKDCTEIGHKPGEGVKALSLVSDGESTLSPYFYDFVLRGKELGIDMAVGTNGFALRPEGKKCYTSHSSHTLEKLLAALTYIRFNISAGEPTRYGEIMGTTANNFYSVTNIIRDCVRIKKENGLSVTIGLQMVLLPEYADQIIPLALLGKELGVDYTIIKHCSDDESGRLGVDYEWYRCPEAIELLKIAEALSTKDYSVQAKWSKMRTGRDRKYSKCYGPPLMLQTSGTCLVAPCGSLFHTDYKEFHIGNFADQRFKDIWASDKYWEIMAYLASDKFDPRKRCATLCLQDKVNEALFDLKEQGIPLPDVAGKPKPMHVNFI